MHADRVARLVASLADNALDGVALLPGPNLFYYTGLSFHLMGRPTMAIFSADHGPVLLVPELERDKAEAGPLPSQIVSVGEDPASRQAALDQLASGLGLAQRRLGVEPLRMRWF